jgi:UDP-N-acetylmuramoyl-tripeptide--D-alanyl-D-alanine ligase
MDTSISVLQLKLERTCVIVPQDIDIEISESHVDIVVVDDSLVAFGLLGKLARTQYSGDVIGVIGSVGKTTTKNMLFVLSGGEESATANRGSFNNETGVPLTLCSIDPDSQCAIIELGESHFGDLHYVASLAQPTMLVVTNVALAHTEYLGDLVGVATTMNEAVQLLSEDAKLILPANIACKDIVIGDTTANVIEVQVHDDHEYTHSLYRVKKVESRSDLSHDVVFEYEDTELQFHVPLSGRHFVENASLAMAACIERGEDPDVLVQRMSMVAPVGHRMRIVEKTDLTLFDDCYNANPTSMEACMDAVAAYAALHSRRSVFFMGEMRELGAASESLHGELALHAEQMGIDVLVCVTPVTRSALSHVGGSTKAIYCESVEDAVSRLAEIVLKGDVVGVKASRGPDPHCPALFPIVESLENNPTYGKDN